MPYNIIFFVRGLELPKIIQNEIISKDHKDHLNVGNAAKQVACFAPYP